MIHWVNNTLSDTQICWNFLLKKMWVVQKLLIFSAKNIRILYIVSTKTVNEMTLNNLVKLTTLWTTGSRLSVNVVSPESVLFTYINGRLRGNFCQRTQHVAQLRGRVCTLKDLAESLKSLSCSVLCWEKKNTKKKTHRSKSFATGSVRGQSRICSNCGSTGWSGLFVVSINSKDSNFHKHGSDKVGSQIFMRSGIDVIWW